MSFFDLKTVFPAETIPKTPKTVLTNFKLKTWFSGRRKRCPTVLSQIAAFGLVHQMLKPRVGWELKKINGLMVQKRTVLEPFKTSPKLFKNLVWWLQMLPDLLPSNCCSKNETDVSNEFTVCSFLRPKTERQFRSQNCKLQGPSQSLSRRTPTNSKAPKR